MDAGAPLKLDDLESLPATFKAVWLVVGDQRIKIPFGMHARRTKDRLGRVRGGPAANYAAKHAPHNMTIGGEPFRGGEFIPDKAYAKASPEEKKAIAGKGTKEPVKGKKEPKVKAPAGAKSPEKKPKLGIKARREARKAKLAAIVESIHRINGEKPSVSEAVKVFSDLDFDDFSDALGDFSEQVSDWDAVDDYWNRVESALEKKSKPSDSRLAPILDDLSSGKIKLESAFDRLGEHASKDDLREVASAAIAARFSREKSVLAKPHGTAKGQMCLGFEFGGVHYRVSEDLGEDGPYRLASLLAELHRSGTNPDPRLSRFTNRVFFVNGKNQDDDQWASQYGLAEFTSAGTGGDGMVTFYSSDKGSDEISDSLTLVHEMGHNLAKHVYGSTTPPEWSAYRKAMDSGEPAVSPYARMSPAEDFAEAVKYFYFRGDAFRAGHPLRHAAIEKMIGDMRNG